MKKPFLCLLFFLTLFVAKSAFSNPVFANATFSGTLDNLAGNIDVNVTVNFWADVENVHTNVGYTNLVVLKNSTAPVYWTDPAGDSGNYSATIFTSCNYVAQNSIFPRGGGSYEFDFVTDIHCGTTNSTTLITTAGCDTSNNGSVSWNINNIGYGGANISEFKVYKHQVNTDFDVDPTIVAYVTSPTTNTYSISGPAPSKLAALAATGTWYVTVKAFPANGDPGIYVTSSSFGCGASSTVVPTNLNANPTCYSSSASRIDFNWSGAQTGSFNYVVQYSTANAADPGSAGTWPNSINVATADLTYASINTLQLASSYWWRVKAVRTSPALTLYSTSSSFITPSVCSGTFNPPGTNYSTVVCASSADNGDLTDSATDSYANANPAWVKVKWDRGSSVTSGTAAIEEEVVEISTDYNFMTNVYKKTYIKGIDDTTSATKILMINSVTFPDMPIVAGTTYNYRIRDKMANNNWYVSAARSFVRPTYCTNAPSSQVGIAINRATGICTSAGVPVMQIGWSVYNSPNQFTNSTLFKVYRGIVTPSNLKGTVSGLYFELYNFTDWGTVPWTVVPYWNGTTAGTAATVAQALSGCLTPSAQMRPNNLSAVASCTGAGSANPTIKFEFNDQSFYETYYYLEVSSEPFTGPYSTNSHSSWALEALPPESGGGDEVEFSWKASSPMTYGDANIQTSQTTDKLIPLDGVTYFWRVKTGHIGGTSAYSYNDGTVAGATLATGLAVKAPVCKPQYDLKVEIDGSSWFDVSDSKFTNSFAVGHQATVNVVVTNVGGVNTNDLPQSVGNVGQLLRFYTYSDSQPTVCPNTSGVAAITDYPLNLPASGLPINGSQTYSVSLQTISPGSKTAYAVIAKDCTFLPDLGIDPNPVNNIASSGYLVGVPKFFETRGGDVGASGNIGVGVDSSALGTPIYQSQYLLAGKSVVADAKVATGGQRIINYERTLGIPGGGGVYSYFANKFRSKAQPIPNTPCAIVGTNDYAIYTNKYYFCGTDLNINGPQSVVISDHPVFFIDGNLTINTNINVGVAGSTPVFIVKGDIKVSKAVTTLKGIYIAQKGFYDAYDGAEVSGAANKLTITGALYVDGVERRGLGQSPLVLSRYFGPEQLDIDRNATTPSDLIIYDPAYIPALNAILGSSAVGWAEKAP